MAAIDTNSASAFRPAALLRAIAARLTGSVTVMDAEDSRTRCAFVQEMTSRNPDAFLSELDVQSMMQHYPGSF